MKVFLILLSCVLSSIGIAQPDKHVNQTLGIACSAGGSPTPSVSQAFTYLETRQYDQIIQLLFSENIASRTIAVFIIEELETRDLVHLTNEERAKMTALYGSKDLIMVCSGCTYTDKVPLRDLLDRKNTHLLRQIVRPDQIKT